MCTSLLKKPGDSEGWTSEGGKNTFGVHIHPWFKRDVKVTATREQLKKDWVSDTV